MPIIFSDDFETGGVTLWTAQDGATNVTAQTTTKYAGAYAARANPSSSQARLRKTITSSATGAIAIRCRRATALGDTPILVYAGNNGSAYMIYMQFFGSTLRIVARDSSGANDYPLDSITAPAIDTWFLLEFAWDVSAATWKVKWRVDGNDRGEFTQGGTLGATTFDAASIGAWAYDFSFDMYYDNIQVSNTYAYISDTLGIYQKLVLDGFPHCYFRMNDLSGQPQDSSGNGNHFQIAPSGALYQQPSPITLDTADRSINWSNGEYVLDHATMDFGDTFTFEVWLKRDDLNVESYLMCKDSGTFAVSISNTNLIRLERFAVGTVCTSTVGITDTTNWWYVLCTKNGAAAANIYLNGVDVSGTVTNQTMVDNANNCNFFRDNIGTRNYQGYADELALYPTYTTPDIVLARYRAGILTHTPSSSARRGVAAVG